MTKLLFLSLFLLPALVCGGDKIAWKEFAPKDAKCKFLMPGEPKTEVRDIGPLTLTSYMLEEKDFAYAVHFLDIPDATEEKEETLQKRLDGARDGMLKNLKATLTKETMVRLAKKYPGRDVTAELPENVGLINNQIFLVNGRLYQVMTIGKGDFVQSADAKKFRASFVLK